MGILNRTPDSFYDRGATWAFDAFLRRAEELVADGADLLDVGGVKAGPGPEVGEAEELDRVVPAIEALAARFDVPLSVDTWRASVLDAACARRCGRRQRHLRVRRSRLPVGRREARRHRRRHPHPAAATRARSRTALRRSRRRRHRVPARARAPRRSGRARAGADRARCRPRPRQVARAECGAPPRDARCTPRSATRCCCRRRTSGSSASSSTVTIDDRGAESLAAVAYGVMHGCRIVRVHDVLGIREGVPDGRGAASAVGARVSTHSGAGRRSRRCATARCSASSTSCSAARIARSRSKTTRSRRAGGRADDGGADDAGERATARRSSSRCSPRSATRCRARRS